MTEAADYLTLERIIEELEANDKLRIRLRNVLLETESPKNQKKKLLKFAGSWKEIPNDEIEKLHSRIEKERV